MERAWTQSMQVQNFDVTASQSGKLLAFALSATVTSATKADCSYAVAMKLSATEGRSTFIIFLRFRFGFWFTIGFMLVIFRMV